MVVSPTTSEVGVPRAQGRARIRPACAYCGATHATRQANADRRGRSAWTGGVVYRLMVDMHV